MLRRFRLAVLLLWVGIGAVFAHPDHGAGVFGTLAGAEAGSQGGLHLSIMLANNSGHAVTLRGLMTGTGSPVSLSRRRTFLGREVLQPVRFLRLDPGERVLLALPDYAVTAPGLTMEALLSRRQRIIADFGPDGIIDLETAGPRQIME